MQFETERLLLRDWQPSQDARHAMDIFGDAKVMSWVDSSSRDRSLRQVQSRLHQYAEMNKQAKSHKAHYGTGSWAVVQKDIGRVIGHIVLALLPDMEEVRPDHTIESDPEGLSTHYIEIGWHFRPASWGFGYATEAAHRIVQYGFDALQLPLLLSVTQKENKRSVAVMEKLGMQYDGITTRFYRGEELLLYRLAPKDFPPAP